MPNTIKLLLQICLSICLLSPLHSWADSMTAITMVNKSSADSAHHKIQLNPLLRTADIGDAISLQISTDEVLDLTVDRKTSFENGDVQLFASNSSGSSSVLTLGLVQSYGSLRHANKSYSIHGDSELVLTELSHPSMPRIQLDDDGVNMPESARADEATMQKLSAQSTNSNGISEVTLLLVYSDEFAQGFNSPLTRINQMVGFTNDALSRSGIQMQLSIARTMQLSFTNNLNNGSLLSAVTNANGDFSGIPAVRNEAGADMVAVLTFNQGFSGSGVAWVNGDSERFAYSVSRFSPVGFDSVFAHELGHNFGSGHERRSANPNIGSPCSTNTFTPYSCGHGNASAGWGTIMSNLDSDRANNVYSTPLLTCVGEPCGIAEGQTGEADNVRSFNMSRLLMAEFRTSPIVDPPTPTPPSTPPRPANSNVDISPTLLLLLDD